MIGALSGMRGKAATAIAAIGAVAAAAVLIWALVLKGQLADEQRLRAADRAAHQQTKANYATAVAQADAAWAAQRLREERARADISEEIGRDFQDRIAAVRAAADRLRRARGTAAAGAAGSAGDGPLPDAAGGADGAAVPGLADAERLRAAEQAIQLDELISWTERQAAVR